MQRREFLAMPVIGGLAALSASGGKAFASRPAPANPLRVKALVFDVFGTVVDWRGSIIKEGEQWGREKNLQIDWGKFADRWRAGYGPSMDKVRKGQLPWMKLDDLHRMILDDLLKEFNITGLTEEEKQHWNRVWHRLYGWPDAVEGLTRLKKNYIIATLSNGNVSLLVEMAKFAGLPWDTVFGSDLFHHFKPDREVYLGAADLLSMKPSEVMMVAAHPPDLNAAASCGLRSGLVPRPLEGGPNRTPPPPVTANATAPSVAFDVTAKDFIDLAAKLS
ncbi:MAG TPA: haloacid dehalogenase type II [Candidatus Acidoferrales bacterium]|nr:haloacid dehalogenase type II [Candidatus Acidoferrales bacterium]